MKDLTFYFGSLRKREEGKQLLPGARRIYNERLKLYYVSAFTGKGSRVEVLYSAKNSKISRAKLERELSGHPEVKEQIKISKIEKIIRIPNLLIKFPEGVIVYRAERENQEESREHKKENKIKSWF